MHSHASNPSPPAGSRIIPRSPIPRLLSWTPATRARRAGLRPPDAFRCGSAINAIPATPVDEQFRWLDIPTTRQRHNLGPLQRKQPRPAAPRDTAARPSARTSPSAQNFSLTQPTSFPSVTTKCGWATTNSPQITTGTNPRSRRHTSRRPAGPLLTSARLTATCCRGFRLHSYQIYDASA